MARPNRKAERRKRRQQERLKQVLVPTPVQPRCRGRQGQWPTGKHCYLTFEAALVGCRRVRQLDPSMSARVFRCDVCCFFHVGRLPHRPFPLQHPPDEGAAALLVHPGGEAGGQAIRHLPRRLVPAAVGAGRAGAVLAVGAHPGEDTTHAAPVSPTVDAVSDTGIH